MFESGCLHSINLIIYIELEAYLPFSNEPIEKPIIFSYGYVKAAKFKVL
jgi:hypothetical protein